MNNRETYKTAIESLWYVIKTETYIITEAA
jgi:hypothetical protein